ncbi:MAG TPA: glycosyltransferase family 2 protein [Marmoricola sp.]|nr:glycosyltransferase family 2 protein [Marmoricola sp.]
MRITALLVTHDGAKWLPGVLRALERSTATPDRFVAVDTGSTDESVTLVADATGTDVVRADVRTSYAEAVRTGLAACPPAEPDEWVWLLHDDAAPAPDCLEVLTATAAARGSDVAAVGPKLREWPSLRRLLEVGVTISPTGRRITGLETGEYDQGQHDEVADVLAVNTAGMLVRRDILEQLGFDERLPVFGNDIDFGWRAARAGHRILVAPSAVMFHVEAARRGRRSGPLAARPRRDERAAAVYTLLVNGRGATLPLRGVRLLLGGLLRALGLLAVRAPGEARDELLGLAKVLVRPGRVLSGRRARRGTAVRGATEVRPLLAPFWLPYRQGLDFVTDVGVAIAHSWRERARRRGPGRSLRAELLRSPSLWAVVAGVVLALVAGRALLAGGDLHGGALLRPPDGVGHWWSLWWQSWHWTGAGSSAPAPAYLLPLASAATVLFGNPGWVIALLFVLAVPLSMYGALRFLRRIVAGRWAPLWGAVAYALLPVLGGAVGQGRLGTVAGAVILPWAATAALGLAADDPDRRWRAAWRTALGVGLLAAFVPVAWLLCLLLVVLAPFLGGRRVGAGQLGVVALVPLLLLAPWAAATIAAPGAWLVEAGRAASFHGRPTGVDLLLARATGPGSAPLWLSVGVPLAAAAALLRSDTRTRVLRAWVAALAAAALLAVTSWTLVSLPGIPFPFRAWPGFLVLAVQACLVVAAVSAADGLLRVISTERFGWRQPVAAVAAVVALGTVLAGVAWWVVAGIPGPLDNHAGEPVPAYMSELAADRDTGGILVLTGDRQLVHYRLLRDGAARIGDDGVLALTPPDAALTSVVSRLLSTDAGNAAQDLAAYGVSYIYAPAPARPAVTAALDASDGLSGASAPRHHTRAWQLSARPDLTAIKPVDDVGHWVLIGLQLLTIVVAVLLALPSRKEAR